jgi:hypothetical protein
VYDLFRKQYIMENDNHPPGNNQNSAEGRMPETAARSTENANPNSNNPNCRAKREKVTPLKMAEFSLLVLVFAATATAACYTRKQWITADDQERRALRAYLGVTSTPFILKCGSCDDPTVPIFVDASFRDTNSITMEIQNFGNTPAFDVKVRTSWAWTPFGQELPDTFEYPDLPFAKGTFPMSGFTLSPGQQSTPTNMLDKTVVEGITKARQHEISAYYYGHIDYQDAFGETPIIDFCTRYAPDAGEGRHFLACTKHNGPRPDRSTSHQ